MKYRTRGTCSRIIEYDVEDGKLKNVRFLGGCDGNLKGIASLTEGLPVEEVIQKLEGIDCSGKGTSCPDQLAKALKEFLAQR